MNRKGFSLTELVVVIAISGIILGIATLNFNNWVRKAQIERQTRELLTDLNEARTESIYRKTRHRFMFEPSSYAFKRYSSENETSSAGTTILSRNIAYQLTRETGGDISDYSLEFDSRGLVTGRNTSSANLTFRINPVNSGASLDCIVVHTVRTNMGKMENGSCVFK